MLRRENAKVRDEVEREGEESSSSNEIFKNEISTSSSFFSLSLFLSLSFSAFPLPFPARTNDPHHPGPGSPAT